MSNRTWACVDCRKSYRRSQDAEAPVCAVCRRPCEHVEWKVRIPSPRRTREWDEFWTEYRAEQKLMELHSRGELQHDVKLRILNRVLVVRKT